MTMTTIMKSIDVSVNDYEVEIELDADDLEDFDSDTLWDALNNTASESEIAEFVTAADGVMEAVFGEMSDEQKRAAKQAWAEDVNAEDVIVSYDALTTPHRESVNRHVLAALTTDERKLAVIDWLAESVEGGALATFLREQIVATGQYAGYTSLREAIMAAPVNDVAVALGARSETLVQVLVELAKVFGGPYVAGRALEAAFLAHNNEASKS
jgi:hypothetical protein